MVAEPVARAIFRGRLLPTALAGLVLVVLLSCYANLGMRFYAKVEPFYDSLAFQSDYLALIDLYGSSGYQGVLERATGRTHSFAYRYLTAILSPVLPRSIVGLYVVLYGMLLLALGAAFFWALGITSSWLKASTFTLWITSAAALAEPYGGIVDQRLDLTAGVLLLSSTLGWYRLLCGPARLTDWTLFLLVTALCVLHRPVSIPQLLLVYIVVLAFRRDRVGALLKQLDARFAAILLIFVAIVGQALGPQFDYLREYYLVRNVDVGRPDSAFEVLRYALQRVAWSIGPQGVLIAAASAVYLGLGKRVRELAEGGLLFAAALAPFVASGSSNPYVFIGSGLLLLLPLLWTLRSVRSRPLLLGLVASGLCFTLANPLTLAGKVEAIDGRPRDTLVEVVGVMADGGRTVVGGTVPVASSLVALDELSARRRLARGRIVAHATDFGLEKTYDLADRQSLQAISAVLARMCRPDGYGVFPAAEVPDQPNSYLFTLRHATLIRQRLDELACVGEALTTFRYEGTAYTVYSMRRPAGVTQSAELGVGVRPS